MQKKRKIWIGTAVVLILVAIGIAAYLNQKPAVEQLATVEKGDIQEIIEETGEICAHQVSTTYADTSEKISLVNVAIGDAVKAGDVLLTYSNAQDLQLAQFQAQLNSAKSKFNAAADESRLATDNLQISLRAAQKQLAQQQALAQAGAVSQQIVTEAADNLQQLQNQLQSLHSTAAATESQYQAQKAELEAGMAVIIHNNERSIITAPFDGIITELTVSSGAMTRAGSPVIEIQSSDSRYLKTDLLVEDAAKLTLGTPVTAHSTDLSVTLTQMAVTKIYPKAIISTSTLGVEQKRIPAEISLPAEAAALPLGAELDVTFIVQSKTDALLLPKNAVYKKEGRQYVLLPGGKTEREVTTGIKQGDNIEILSGLKEGEQVMANI